MVREPNAGAAFTFASSSGYYAELKARVEEHFARLGRSPYGGARLLLKAAVVLAWTVLSYALLVFAASTWWQAVLLALSLALAIAAIGFNIQHDGGHGAVSEHRPLNRLMALMLDAVGGSSYVWVFKHNILHHTYTNLAGADDDIDMGALGRMSPAQPWRWFHRFQHLYFWPLYATVALKWQWVDDFRRVAAGRMGTRRFPRPRNTDLVVLFAGKVFFAGWALALPALFHPIWQVVLVYVATMLVVGVVLAVVFQLAHTVAEAAHPAPPEGNTRLTVDWAVHQVQTTVDFARRNRLLSWYIGGLNFQVEHHLFPRVSHIHYPALSRIVEEVSARFGVRYAANRSFLGAIASHFRFLRAMGRPDMLPA
jgi:linoleoyl-CoA desaturase